MINKIRPILLWMTSRSRSSMVARIFAEHGVWWGDTYFQTGAGYTPYENKDINNLQKKYKPKWGRPFMRPVTLTDELREQWDNDLHWIVPKDKQWMYKTGVEYFPAYEHLNPFNIFIKRKPEDVAKSLCEKRKDANYNEALNVAIWRFNYMDGIFLKHGGMSVSTDRLINNDFVEIKLALEYCGLEFNEEKVKRAITK